MFDDIINISDSPVSVQSNETDAGAGEEDWGALNTSDSLAQPALQWTRESREIIHSYHIFSQRPVLVDNIQESERYGCGGEKKISHRKIGNQHIASSQQHLRALELDNHESAIITLLVQKANSIAKLDRVPTTIIKL